MDANITPGRNFTPGELNPYNCFSLNGALYDIGTRVIRWGEEKGFNGYTRKRVVVEDRRSEKQHVIKGNRFKKRKGGVGRISQFLIHHSGGDGKDPRNMYDNLYMNRGLSVQYAGEDDGRLYQFNDAVDHCYHAKGHGGISIGVESCLFPLVKSRPDYYSAARRKRTGNLPHKKMVDVIHGQKLKVFCFTEPQLDALARLAAGNWLAVQLQTGQDFEAPEFPRNKKGEIPRTVVHKPKEHVGLIGHLQTTRRKIDPAGFPWEEFEELVHYYYHQFIKDCTRI